LGIAQDTHPIIKPKEAASETAALFPSVAAIFFRVRPCEFVGMAAASSTGLGHLAADFQNSF
jgi:hypothetical protein